MSHTKKGRGSRSHLNQENRIKTKLKRWSVQTMVIIMVIVTTLYFTRDVPDNDTVTNQFEAMTKPTVRVESSTTSTSLNPTRAQPQLEVLPNAPTVTEVTSTTSTTLPEPELANVGSLNYPADPILVTMSFKATSEPYDDGLVNTITCNGQAELHVAIPSNWQRLEKSETDSTYYVWTDNAAYSAAGFSLSPTCVGTLPNEGIEEIPNAGYLFGLHDEDGKRTDVANQLLADLALASSCVSEADVNLHKLTRQLLKDTFMNANPFVDESKVKVDVNQPDTLSIEEVTIFPGDYSLEFIVEPRCEKN